MASPARSIGAAESWQKHKLREQLLRAGLLSSTPDQGTTGRYVNELSRSAEDAPQAGTGYSTPSACQTPRIPKGGGGNNDEFEFESFPYENSATQPLLASEARLQVVPEKRLKKTERRAVERVTRERKKTTYWQCVSNVLNLYVGIGLLSKPYAVRIGGWASLGLLAVICVVFNQTAKILSRSFDALGCSGNAQEHHSLAYLAEQVLGRRGKQLVTCLVLLEFMGALCMCLIIVWSSLASLFPELGLTNAVVGITTVALVPVLLIDDYSRMSFLSMIGVLSNFMIVVSLVALIADDPNRKDIKSFHLPETDEYSIFNPGQAPIAMGIFVVSLAGHASLPTLRANMIDPSEFDSVLDVSFALMFLIYASCGIAGYFYFASYSSVLVTTDIDEFTHSTDGKEVGLRINQITIGMVLLSSFSTIGPVISVIADSIEDVKRIDSRAVAILSRLGLLFIGVTIARATFSYLGNLESLIGMLSSLTVSLVLPLIFKLRLEGNELTKTTKVFLKVSIGMGLGMTAAGVVANVFSLL